MTKMQTIQLWKSLPFMEWEVIEDRASNPTMYPKVAAWFDKFINIPRTSRSWEEMEMKAELLLMAMSRNIQSIEN